MIVALCFFAWWATGLSCFAYWWTTDHDLSLGMFLAAAIIIAWMGPVNFLFGYALHGNHRNPIIVMKRR